MKKLIIAMIATIVISFKATNKLFASGSGLPENDVLASELNFFTIKAINQTTLLTWSSSNPMTNNYFVIERSNDGKTYSQIGKVKSTGTTNFSFVDYNPNPNINYYRFRKVEFDGSVAVSPVRVVVIEKDSPFTVYPTIVKSTLTLQNNISADIDSDAKVQFILASTGEVMQETTLEANNSRIDINLSSLPSGNYVAKILKDKKEFNHTFVKQ